MITPEQLAEALDRIHPRDRELLSLSLRRRVPDEALGKLYECSPSEVARLRARAIERLADEMELQRGEDLGAVLKALLEPATWGRAAPALGEEFAAGGSRSHLAAVPLPAPEEEPEAPPALAPVPPAPEPEPEPVTETEPQLEPAPDPVEEMVAEREREAPDPPRRAVPLALLGLGVAALVGAAGVLGATQFGDSQRLVPRPDTPDGGGTRHFVPEQGGPLAAPFPTEPDDSNCYATATVSNPTALYRDPGGEKRISITPRTEWGSSRVLGVVSQRGEWLGVQASELKNGEVAWIEQSKVKLDCVTWSLHADLSKRVLSVRHDGRTVRKLHVAIGRTSNPTPKGRFSVTDRLKVTSSESPYGCCVLALTGHQTNLPPYWPGGDRLAVHATDDESSIGHPVSLGCLRADSAAARWLINSIPLGSPVFIRA